MLRVETWTVLAAIVAGLLAIMVVVTGALRRRRLEEAVGARLRALGGSARAASLARDSAVALALLLGALAWLGPAGRDGAPAAAPPSLDVVVCLDVSRSMLARDERPDRLSAAKADIARLVEYAPEHRYALVLFAGEARLALPRTRDARAFTEALDAADPLSVRVGGSDVGAALDRARAALFGVAPGAGVVLLFADGEDGAGRAPDAASALAQAGFPLHAIVYGSERGARIPVALDGGGEAFLTDRAGAPVVTRADPASAATWARIAGGRAHGRDTIALHDAELVPLARAAERERRGEERTDLFHVPLSFAVVLVACALVFPLRTGRRGPTRRAPLAKRVPLAAAILVVPLTVGGWREARERFDSGDAAGAYALLEPLLTEDAPDALRHDLGRAALEAGRLGDALRIALELADRGGELTPRARFLAAAASFEDARRRAALAREPSAPAAALDDALARARAALDGFRAIEERPLLPAAARNAERAWRLCAELESLRAARPREEGEPDLAPEPEQPPEPDEPPGGEEPEPPREPLPETRVIDLMERLAAKDVEKRTTRTATRAERTAALGDDW